MGIAGTPGSAEAVRVTNPGGRSPFVLVCDHASNFIPPEYGMLGLPAAELSRHIAWDPGALPVAQYLAKALDATLVRSCISRLVIDVNRPLDAGNLIWTVSEDTLIPGNQRLDDVERQRRIAISYDPFHAALDRVISERLAARRESWVVSIHSFTPVYCGVHRPWKIGIIHDQDERLAVPLIAGLREDASLAVGVNQPYAPADKVYFTLERHARSRGLACAMIEIRNDEIADEGGQRRWSERLAGIFNRLTPGEWAGDAGVDAGWQRVQQPNR